MPEHCRLYATQQICEDALLCYRFRFSKSDNTSIHCWFPCYYFDYFNKSIDWEKKERTVTNFLPVDDINPKPAKISKVKGEIACTFETFRNGFSEKFTSSNSKLFSCLRSVRRVICTEVPKWRRWEQNIFVFTSFWFFYKIPWLLFSRR